MSGRFRPDPVAALTGPRLLHVVHVDELRDRIDVLLRGRRADGDGREVRLPRQDDVLEHLRFTPQPVGLAVRVVVGAVDREDRKRSMPSASAPEAFGSASSSFSASARYSGVVSVRPDPPNPAVMKRSGIMPSS